MPSRARAAIQRWEYLARFLFVWLCSAGQVDALRYAFNLPRRGLVCHLSMVETGSDEEKAKPRRLHTVATRMPTRQEDLLNIIEEWNISTPDTASKMRVQDLREIIFDFDATLGKKKETVKPNLQEWGDKKIGFGEVYLGKAYHVAASDEGFTNFIVHRAKHRNQAMEDFVRYVKAVKPPATAAASSAAAAAQPARARPRARARARSCRGRAPQSGGLRCEARARARSWARYARSSAALRAVPLVF